MGLSLPRICNIRTVTKRDLPSAADAAVLKIIALDGETPPTGIPLAFAGKTPSEKHFDRYADFCADINPLGLFKISKEVVAAGSGFVLVDGCLLDAPELLPNYVRHLVDKGERWDLNFSYPLRKLAEPAMIVCSDAHRIYGHWLIDILPRLWFAQTFFGELALNMKLLLPIDTPKFARAILDQFFAHSQVIEYDLYNENIVLPAALIPPLLHVDHAFHSVMNLFVSAMISHPRVLRALRSCVGPERIYVSRSEFQKQSFSYSRSIANEHEIIAIVERNDFTIIRPEALSWCEQIALFSSAKVVVGEGGSGLHNALFSPSQSSVICINPKNQVQSTIANVRRQHLGYVCGNLIDEAKQIYKIDIDRFGRAVEAALARTKALQ